MCGNLEKKMELNLNFIVKKIMIKIIMVKERKNL
jgi:hypothetical protein